jgi:hypothetical protein
MRPMCAAVVVLIAVLPADVRAQPAIGGSSIRPDGPGRFVIENERGQQKGTVVETGAGVYRFRNELGQLSDWTLKKRPDGGFDFVPSPFGKPKQSR